MGSTLHIQAWASHDPMAWGPLCPLLQSLHFPSSYIVRKLLGTRWGAQGHMTMHMGFPSQCFRYFKYTFCFIPFGKLEWNVLAGSERWVDFLIPVGFWFCVLSQRSREMSLVITQSMREFIDFHSDGLEKTKKMLFGHVHIYIYICMFPPFVPQCFFPERGPISRQ